MTEDTTTTSWNTKLLNAWTKFYAWAKLHPGIMIPGTAYLAGMATVIVARWIF